MMIIGKNWHQGNRNGRGFSVLTTPDESGETKSGWTFTATGGNASAVSFANGLAAFTVQRYTGTDKQFVWWRPTKANILKSSVFSFAQKIKFGSTYSPYFSLHNSAEPRPGVKNTVRLVHSAEPAVYLNVSDSAGTPYSNYAFPATVSTETWYWVEVIGNGTVITAKWYSSLANFWAKSSPTFSLSLNVSSITGTVTCDRFGLCALDSTVITATPTIEWVDSPNVAWY